MKRHYEVEYNLIEDGWTRLHGRYSKLADIRRKIRQSQFPNRMRIIQITEKVIHPKKKARK